jgi:DNA-binding response OmpR family regulator
MKKEEEHTTAGQQLVSKDIKKYRIMIVDDEEDITTIFRIGLEKNEFIVTTFNDPLKALAAFKPGLFDLLLLDIRMPGLNGFELYEKIRARDQRVKVCFLTAFDSYRSEFKNTFPSLEEVKCFLKKPITVSELVKKLRELAAT